MKITTTIEVTKQEKNIIYNALQAYQNYLDDLAKSNKGFDSKIVNNLIVTVNELFSQLEKEM